MRYFANPSIQSVRDLMAAGVLDVIETPKQGNKPVLGATWCADNGCFSDAWVESKWWAWLVANSGRAETCAFAVLPDVVADAWETMKRSLPWSQRVRDLGYKPAFVIQDGQENIPMPWGAFDVLFIGGSTDWKLGRHARQIVREAKARGKWVHMGRVNTEKRWRYAQAIGCDSCDGTTLAQFGKATLPDVLAWHRLNDHMPMLAITG